MEQVDNFTRRFKYSTSKASAANQGTTTAGLIFGGYKQSPNTSIANVESWNGSAWTETADVNTAREQAGGGGTSTAAFCKWLCL